MRILFVVNSIKSIRSSYTTVYLAVAAARRGHEVAFVSVDQLSHERQVTGRVVKPPLPASQAPASMVEALKAASFPGREESLTAFDVVLLRNNPHVDNGGSPRVNPAIELGRRIREAGVLVLSDPDGLRRAGSKMYLAGFPTQIRPRTLITCSADRVRAFLHLRRSEEALFRTTMPTVPYGKNSGIAGLPIPSSIYSEVSVIEKNSKGMALTDLEFAHPQDVVAVRVRDDATVRDGSILVPSRIVGGSAWPYAIRPSRLRSSSALRHGRIRVVLFGASSSRSLRAGGPPKSAVLTDNTREHRSQQERRPMAINAKGKNTIFAPMAPDVKDALVKLIRSLKPVRIESFVP